MLIKKAVPVCEYWALKLNIYAARLDLVGVKRIARGIQCIRRVQVRAVARQITIRAKIEAKEVGEE